MEKHYDVVWTAEAIESQKLKPIQERLHLFANFLLVKKEEWMWEDISNRRTAGDSAFAKHLGVAGTSFSNWMQEQRPPSQDNLDRVAAKLGIDVYWIMGETPRIPTDNPQMLRWFVAYQKLTGEQRKEATVIISNLAASADEEEASKQRNTVVMA